MFRFLIGIFIFITLILPQSSFAKNKIDTASDYAKIEKKYEAKKLLDEAILEDPLDASVHYKAGLVYSQLGMAGDFDLAMKNACKLKSSYCPKVAEPYYSVGLKYLYSGSQRRAINSFEKAFAYNPEKKQEAITKIYSRGKSLLEGGNISNADSFFSALTSLDSGYGDKISSIYIQKSPNVSAESAVFLLKKAVNYSSSCKKEVGNLLAEMAKDNKYSEKEKSTFKREAGKYLSESEMLAHFPPDYKIYPPRSEPYVFDLKPGEIIDLWIMFPSGRNNNFSLSSNDDKFIVMFDDGTRDNAWEVSSSKKRTRLKFKIKAVTSQQITMKVW